MVRERNLTSAAPHARPLPLSQTSGGRAVLRTGQAQIAEALGLEIVAGKYLPGSNLPHESELLAHFGVSRPVLREVLKTLAAKGLVVSKTKIGTRVRPQADWNFFDVDLLRWKVQNGMDEEFQGHLADMRRAVEPRAAALAADRRTDADLARLRGCIIAMSNPQHSERSFAEADAAFHVTLAEISGNPLIRSMAGAIEAALLAAFSFSSPMDHPDDHMRSVAEHAAIVDAIAARDGDAASAAILSVIDFGISRRSVDADQASNGKRRNR